jgi:hypothetical protein
MEITISPRASGKTTLMIKWLKADKNRILLTFNHQEADRLKYTYPEISQRIYCWEEWKEKQHGVEKKEIGIDNANYILQHMLKHEIKKITMSDD